MSFYRPTTWDDVDFVSKYMREEDKEECIAGGLLPHHALSLSYEGAIVAYTLLTPNTHIPGAVLGVGMSNLNPCMGVIWMLGTDAIKTHRFTFLRNCKPVLNELYEITGKDCFYNYTYSKNTLHHAWLKWLGFKFLREVSLPPDGNTFLEFVRLKG